MTRIGLIWLFLFSLIWLLQCTRENAPTASTQNSEEPSPSILSQSVRQQGDLKIVEGKMESGAHYRYYIPIDWNQDLVVYAHGYVSPLEPLGIPENQLQLPDGTSIPELVTEQGYVFAVTSYRQNGLAAPEAVIDLVELTYLFNTLFQDAHHVYLVGASEGGLITAQSIETKRIYDGGLATCGPVGDFRKQINYFGDFRVVFDYFFPDVLPASAVDIPEEVQRNWSGQYVPAIIKAISSEPEKTLQLLRVTRAPFDPQNEETIGETVLGLLWYNVFATNDARIKLGGQPFDNSQRRYRGSANDAHLNANVERFSADAAALQSIKEDYQTDGEPRFPLITMHTLADPIVPAWHARLYRNKTISNEDRLHKHIPVVRYGHCNFTADELMQAFNTLVLMVNGREELLPPEPDLAGRTNSVIKHEIE